MFSFNQPKQTARQRLDLDRIKLKVKALEETLTPQVDTEIKTTNSEVTYPKQMQLLKQYKDELLALQGINTESELAFLSKYRELLEAYQKFTNANSNQNTEDYTTFNNALQKMAYANQYFYENNIEQFLDIQAPPMVIYNKINIALGIMLAIGFCLMMVGICLCPFLAPLALAGVAIIAAALLLCFVHMGCIQSRWHTFYDTTFKDFNAIRDASSSDTTLKNKTDARNKLGNFQRLIETLFNKPLNYKSRNDNRSSIFQLR